jgi:hypothetical protein
MLTKDRDTLSEIKQMLQKNQETISTSVRTTESIRSANPMIRVASSIYDSEDHTGSMIIPDNVSIVASSELEFEFDNIIINSQAYRRVFAKAHAKTRTRNEEELGDLIDFTDNATSKHEESSAADLPATFDDLVGLSIGPVHLHAPKIPKPPPKVKAVSTYTSSHEDDLQFHNGQINPVTGEEDESLYAGEYVDVSGVNHEGMFPKNCVKKYTAETNSVVKTNSIATRLERITAKDAKKKTPNPLSSDFGNCSKCNENLLPGNKLVRVEGKRYHLGCFRCQVSPGLAVIPNFRY